MTIPTHELTPQLRRVIKDTRKIYVDSAKWLISHHPSLLGDKVAGFVALMDDLHRGLLVKVYANVIRADGQWTRMEKIVGAIMIEHLWNAKLTGSELREAAQQVLAQADSLQWEALVRPFVEYPPLRDWHSQIETSVTRLANLVAKCDGLTTPEETNVLHQIQQNVIQALMLEPASASSQQTFVTSPASRPSDSSADVLDEQDIDPPEKRLQSSLSELEHLIGLQQVKERIRSLANYLWLQNQRAAAGYPTMPISLHMSFVGNPGTGKTTVARIVGQILGAMGVLSKGHVVETDRSGLVAEFAGQTAVKTNKLIDSALDGVLFIDEAYSLVDESGDDAFGREALQILLKRMEDDRDRLVVILAGYPDEMDSMIRSNPGFSSRVGTRLVFEDYSPADLGRIFELLCNANHYRLPAASRHRVLLGIAEAYAARDRHFGNGRLARNCFEESVRQLANRVAEIMPLTEELLTTLEPEDVVIVGVSENQIDRMIADDPVMRVSCSQCGKRLKIAPRLLGRKVQCRECTTVFVADWATVERQE